MVSYTRPEDSYAEGRTALKAKVVQGEKIQK